MGRLQRASQSFEISDVLSTGSYVEIRCANFSAIVYRLAFRLAGATSSEQNCRARYAFLVAPIHCRRYRVLSTSQCSDFGTDRLGTESLPRFSALAKKGIPMRSWVLFGILAFLVFGV